MIKIGKYKTIVYKGKKLDISTANYAEGGRMALTATLHGTGEPYDVLTVNIPAWDDYFPDMDIIFLDNNNVPGIFECLKQHGLIEDLGGKVWSGFCMYPVGRWLG